MSDSTPNDRSRTVAPDAAAPAAPIDRPKKPYPEFPLTPHPSGAWQKHIRGRIHYFGRWARRVNGKLVRVEGDGWREALEEYKKVADDLHAGRTPRTKTDGLTVADLCNRFLTAKLRKWQAGEIGPRSFGEYRDTTDLLVNAFGKTRLVDDLAADDFEALRATMAGRWGPARLGNGMRHRAANGTKMLEAADLHQLLDAARVPMRAMILLGLNCGFGNSDLATLPLSALDLDSGWVDFPRPKTGIARRCPLWPETIAALRAAIAARPAPHDPADAGLVFLMRNGRRWVHYAERSRTNRVSLHFRALLRRCGLYRAGLGFYTLRHVFRTIADAARDPVAADLIMGHSDSTMASHYRERIDAARLLAVAEHVRTWLFAADKGGPDGTTGGK
jgi:integrase